MSPDEQPGTIDVDHYTSGISDASCRYALATLRQRLDEHNLGLIAGPDGVRLVPVRDTLPDITAELVAGGMVNTLVLNGIA